MEFKVRTQHLKRASTGANSTTREIKQARNSVESVIKRIDLGASTGEIQRQLRKSSDDLSFLEAATSGIKRNMEAIATQYALTEIAVRNQSSSVIRPDIMDKIKKAIHDFNAAVQDTFRKGNNRANRKGGDPVNLDTGNYIYEKKDLTIGGAEEFSFCRFYNSMGGKAGTLGRGWIHNFEMSLTAGIDNVLVTLADGREDLFIREAGEFHAFGGSTATLTKEDERYRYTTLDGVTYTFDGEGKLLRREDANGNGWSIEYENGKPSRVIRDGGEFFMFRYADDELASVTDHAGRKAEYEYSDGKLVSVSVEGQTVKYEYDGAGRLASIINTRGIRIIANEYDNQGRTMRQDFPDDSSVAFSYDETSGATVLTEKNGSESYHFHDELFRNTENVYTNGTESVRFDEMDQPVFVRDRNGNETHITYDNRGNISKIVNPDGTAVTLTYEKHNKPVTITVNGVRKQKNVYDDKGNLLETVDGLGRKTSYKYNSRGCVTEVRRPGGTKVALTYDGRNNMTSVTDESGATTVYEYDDLNRVIRKTDGRGNTTRYEYDAHNNMLTEINALGDISTYRYNEINKVAEYTDFNSAKTQIAYNRLGLPETVTDAAGRITGFGYDVMWNNNEMLMPNGGIRRMEYDENNNPAKLIDALGNETLYEYDGNGNVIAITDPEGAVTVMGYDGEDHLISVADSEGNTTSYEYKAGNLVHVTNANGGTVDLEYDAADQLIREVNALGESREYMYTPDGDISRVIDEAGRMTSYEYAFKGHPSLISYPDGSEEHYTYDANGNILTLANRQGYTAAYTYDALDRVTEVRDSRGGVTSYSYDSTDNIVSMTDANGNTTHYEYTLTGKISSVTDAEGNRTEYTYDDIDQLIAIDQFGDGETHTTRYIRDAEGHVTEAIDPLGLSDRFVYNRRGELIEKTDKDGYVTGYGYDGNGNMTSIAYSDGKEVMMTYDTFGNLSAIQDWTGATTIESDLLGRVTGVTYPDSRHVSYSYGSAGECREMTYPDGRTVRYGYDDALRLASLREGDTLINYRYNEDGRLAGKVFAGGAETEYFYDPCGLLKESRTINGEELIDSFSYTYDLLGNKTEVLKYRKDIPEESGSFKYGYDALGRLETVSRDGLLSRKYTYDAFGNRTALEENGAKSDYRYNAANQLIGITGPDGRTESLRYDKRGNLTERTLNGSVITTYAYGVMNRLENAHSLTGTSSYEYNGLGHRIGETRTIGSGPEEKIRYTVDVTRSYHNLFEKSVNGRSEAYLWDTGVAAVKAGTAGTSLYYMHDDLGSPVRLLDHSGGTAASCGYDEFGMPVSGTGSMNELQPFGYTGYRTDPVSGTYFAQAREYMPEYGRFAAQDRDKGRLEFTYTLNPYVYCWDNPETFVDLDGDLPIVLATIAGTIWVSNRVLGSKSPFYVPSKEEHYARNKYNTDLPPNAREAERQGWDDSVAANCHQFTAEGGRNKKYVSPDGKREVIYDPSGQRIVRAPEDTGTYNYWPSGGKNLLEKAINGLGHFTHDMIPWFRWGNAEDDSTKPIQRVWYTVNGPEIVKKAKKGLEKMGKALREAGVGAPLYHAFRNFDHKGVCIV